LSAISNARIENAEYGIRIRELCAPSLSGVTFSKITGDRHVMLDGTDVIIPLVFEFGDSGQIVGSGSWDLEGSTHVVASEPVLNDADVGETGKADLIVYGGLATTGSAAPGDTVYFRSEAKDQVFGDDWGGIFFSSYVSGAAIDYADIGYAINPLFVHFPPAFTTITNSRIHHFKKTGIWVSEMAEGVAINNCIVERGSSLDVGYGYRGDLP
jgi:hypothetical protein